MTTPRFRTRASTATTTRNFGVVEVVAGKNVRRTLRRFGVRPRRETEGQRRDDAVQSRSPAHPAASREPGDGDGNAAAPRSSRDRVLGDGRARSARLRSSPSSTCSATAPRTEPPGPVVARGSRPRRANSWRRVGTRSTSIGARSRWISPNRGKPARFSWRDFDRDRRRRPPPPRARSTTRSRNTAAAARCFVARWRVTFTRDGRGVGGGVGGRQRGHRAPRAQDDDGSGAHGRGR